MEPSKLPAFVKRRNKQIKKLFDRGLAPAQVREKLEAMEDEFVEKHKMVLERYTRTVVTAMSQFGQATSCMGVEYARLAGPGAVIPIYKSITDISFDSEGRLISLEWPGVQKELTAWDLDRATAAWVERVPWNDHFHNQLTSALASPPREEKEYEKHTRKLLWQAYRNLGAEKSDEAIWRAASALEVALRGFLVENQVLEEGSNGGYTLHVMMSQLFDEAVRKVEGQSYAQRSKIFDRSLFKKVISTGSRSQGASSLHKIRSSLIHEGRLPGTRDQSTYPLGLAAVFTYHDAVEFILGERWRESRPAYSGDVFGYLAPWVGQEMHLADDRQVDNSLVAGLQRVLEFLPDDHIAYLAENIPGDSWAYKTILNETR